MQARLDPFSFLIVSIAGWMNQRQYRVIQYLIEENRVFREQMGNHGCGLAMTSAVVSPPRQRSLAENYWPRSQPSSHPQRCWPGTGNRLPRNTMAVLTDGQDDRE